MGYFVFNVGLVEVNDIFGMVKQRFLPVLFLYIWFCFHFMLLAYWICCVGVGVEVGGARVVFGSKYSLIFAHDVLICRVVPL